MTTLFDNRMHEREKGGGRESKSIASSSSSSSSLSFFVVSAVPLSPTSGKEFNNISPQKYEGKNIFLLFSKEFIKKVKYFSRDVCQIVCLGTCMVFPSSETAAEKRKGEGG